MERKNVNVYFSNGDGCLIFGNYPESPNEIEDFQMEQLESWAQTQSYICRIENKSGDIYIINPNQIGYVKICNG
ncbi:MAG: hypothetical protein ACLVL6_14620 [Clostridium paraputrificum]|jgi:hypothetical protein|nr:MAG TPA: hypothetical protein [Caudoviricetes sp.]